MNYEEKYKEAMERAKKFEEKYGGGYAGYIFPELRESEDEMIRKWLIKTVRLIGVDKDICADQETMDKAIAYLEKQKINTEGDFGRGYDCGYEACLNSHGAEWLEKQKEPVVDKEGMYYYLGGKFIYCGYPATGENPYDFAMSQQENQKEQKPLTEEEYRKTSDELYKNHPWYMQKPTDKCPEYCAGSHCIDCSIYEKQKEQNLIMANSPQLKEQKPAEWSEEDKRILKGIIGLIDHNQHYNVSNKEMLKWLKSLRPSWKPTEEQMTAILRAEGVLRLHEQEEVAKRLAELYEHLKKLKEDKK